MAENTLHLVISSVGGALFDGAVVSATVPGSAGEFTVLPNHEALVTTLKEGVVRVKLSDGSSKEFPVSSGVLEHSSARTIVLL